MRRLRAQTIALVFGTHDSWSLTRQPRFKEVGIKCSVRLEILGDEKDGYHLIQSPDGFFTADDWYLTIAEAQRSARDLFGVTLQQWSEEGAT